MIAACRLAVTEVLDADELNREHEALEEKFILLNEHIRRLVNDGARIMMAQTAYQKEYGELCVRCGEAMTRIKENDGRNRTEIYP